MIVVQFPNKVTSFIHYFLQVETQKLDWNVKSKIGSMDNANHQAGGGERKVNTLFKHPVYVHSKWGGGHCLPCGHAYTLYVT